jgi:hypothetical protein
MFQKLNGWIVGAVISIIATTVAVQLEFLGPSGSFIQNLGVVAVIWVGSRVVAWFISRR